MSKRGIPTRKEKLSVVAAKKLSKNANEQIGFIDLEILTEVEPGIWEISEFHSSRTARSRFKLDIDDQKIRLFLVANISFKKFLAWVGGITTFSVAVVKVLAWLVPILQTYLSKAPPIP